ncbi:MAG: Gldg family protein [Candidatus Latescibacterota bacterium]
MKQYTVPLSLVGAALVLAGGLARLLSPEAGYASLANVVVGLAAIIAAGALNPGLFRQYGRWLNAFWGALMVLGIVAMVNFLADRYPKRADLTAGGLHSLSDLTVKTLESLDQDVQALAFVEGGKDEKTEGLLKEYAAHTPHFDYELLDPEAQPERAREFGVRRYNTLVITRGSQQQTVTELQEKEITNGLLKAIRQRREQVYFTVGHGEAGLGEEAQELGTVKQRLGEYGYTVEDSLFLARAGEVPQDCSVLVIAGPHGPFLPTEVEAIERYLERGGSLLALLDPVYDSGLQKLLARWGVQVGNDFVIDTSGIGSLFGLDFTTPVSADYGDHPITARHHGLMTFFQLVRSVTSGGGERQGLQGVDLVKTSSQGWAEADVSVLQARGRTTVGMDEKVDRPGPVSLGAAVTAQVEGGDQAARLTVFGDSDFASNQFFSYQGNGDLVLNALSWLAEDEGLIAIRPREPGHNPISLTDHQARLIFWLTVVLLPAGVALAGLVVVSRKGRWSLRDLAAAGLGFVLAVGVVALLNFVADRYRYRVDVTQDDLFTLSGDTRQVLDEMDDSGQLVHARVFMSEMDGSRFQDILREYDYAGRNFDFEVVDPQKNALLVKQYGVRERGTTVLEVSGKGKVRTERITEQTESALSNAIRKALRAGSTKVYFTTGHGERRLDEADESGFSILKGRLKEMNLEVAEDLRLDQGVPDDAAIVAVLSPRNRFTVAEAGAISAHLRKGRAGLFLLDPAVDPGLQGVLGAYGVEVGNDFIIDRGVVGQMFGAEASVPVVINYADHPITERLRQGMMSFYPLARSVSPGTGSLPNAEARTLAFTDRSSWAESDLAPITGGGGTVEFSPEGDRRGPISLAVAATADADTSAGAEAGAETRLVVFGDADFASNQNFGQQANGELAVASITWLCEGEDRLNIPAREPRFNPINVVGTQGTVILWVSVFVLPFAVALSGMVMVLRRGYQTHAGGFASWLVYTFAANAVFFFIAAVVRMSEMKWPAAEGTLLMALLCAGAAYGIFRRLRWAWGPLLLLTLVTAAVGALWVIPHQTIRMIYAALFVTNAAILVWIRRTFEE